MNMDPEIRLKFCPLAHDYLHPAYPTGTPSSFCSDIIYVNIEKGVEHDRRTGIAWYTLRPNYKVNFN